MSIFDAFTPLAGGTPDTYYYPNEYPYNLDAGLDFTRPATGISPFPMPTMLPALNGFCPMFDGVEMQLMTGVQMQGPWVGGTWVGAGPDAAEVFPNLMGGAAKVEG